ncbi:Zn-binding Pro-Ala-Ala-Arg (PAAR) domain-containing protein, incolved in TypeVI secretion [Pasteurella testudinis DSM 23072]|uniref:Zn-binding Pro-Ala-Ala-Arg (PAAR) domain-containing protein, incolved in TypeVI secretion n=1 Tax=Pasteurella testudinis DSM 23072 TaxID=1122938 RepID=A0A1W1UFI4_9PAST|nr:PAAR domain-containing protein [Pasteurella testudinis]SMB79554.1 Zn-binding Pro-Ala-Ala-Arg (PAAR) domain-containing protein, incolved in TypeVI secretion [Pasteurella testudinis DSM 23072]SUB50724.1 Uncharacterized conserved protein [Pasteurella testudinis]
MENKPKTGEEIAAEAIQRITTRINSFPRSKVHLVGKRENIAPFTRVGDTIKHKSLLGATTGAIVGGIISSSPYILAGFLGPFGAAARIGFMLFEASRSLNTKTSQTREPDWAEKAAEATRKFVDNCLSGEDGYITQGSNSIFINGKPAAFAGLNNSINCNNHSLKVIASGSETVFLHNQSAAREGDCTSCGAKIMTGSPNVFIGSGNAIVTDIEEEFSPREKALLVAIEMSSPPSISSMRKGLGKIQLGLNDIKAEAKNFIKSELSTEKLNLAKINDKKRMTLKNNSKRGKKREHEVKRELLKEGYNILGSQVSVKTEYSRRVIDHMVKKDDIISAIEVKSGNAKRSSLQILKDNSMAKTGAKVIGKNAPDNLKNKVITIETTVRN